MGINQSYTCDCCGNDMPDSSVLSCVILTRLEESGEVLQHYFCLAYGCAAAFNKAVAALPGKHANHAVTPPPAEANPPAPIEPPVADGETVETAPA